MYPAVVAMAAAITNAQTDQRDRFLFISPKV
jgi:hypothetical protein